jgi:hypothetical protein
MAKMMDFFRKRNRAVSSASEIMPTEPCTKPNSHLQQETGANVLRRGQPQNTHTNTSFTSVNQCPIRPDHDILAQNVTSASSHFIELNAARNATRQRELEEAGASYRGPILSSTGSPASTILPDYPEVVDAGILNRELSTYQDPTATVVVAPTSPPTDNNNSTTAAELDTTAKFYALKLLDSVRPLYGSFRTGIEAFVKASPDPQSTFLLVCTFAFILCMTMIYLVYSILVARLTLLLATALVIAAMYAFSYNFSVLKGTEVKKQWIRTIGPNVQGSQLTADMMRPRPTQPRMISMPQNTGRVRELEYGDWEVEE